MFNWISSYFGSSSNQKNLAIEGKLLKTDGKTVKTLFMSCTFKLNQGETQNEYEYVFRVDSNEDDESFMWDCDDTRQFSLVHSESAFCWRGDDQDFHNWYIFELKGGNVQANAALLRSVISECLYAADKSKFPTESDDISSMIGRMTFDFNLDTLEWKKGKQPSQQPAYPSAQPTRPPPNQATVYDNEVLVIDTVGELYYLDKKNVFQFRGKDLRMVLIRIGEPKDFLYMIYIEKMGKRVLQQVVSADMNLQLLTKQNAVVWTLDKPWSTWSFIIQKNEIKFKSFIVAAVWESQNQKAFSDLKADDQDYIIQSCIADKPQQTPQNEEDEDFNMKDEYMDFMEDEDDDYDEEPEYYSDEEEENFVSSSAKQPSSSKGDVNSLLIDSSKHHRCFVVRGNNVGVFKRDGEDVEYDTMMSNISSLKGKGFIPQRLMLHNQESSLLMTNNQQGQNSDHRGKIYRLDLNRGKVVEEWTADGEDVPVHNIANVQKYSEQLPQQVFTATNKNTIFGMDPRINKQNKAVGNLLNYQYKKNPNFTCVATSSDGHVAVGSQNGTIRLFSGTPGLDKFSGRGQNPKTAKTNLPAFGDPIKGIDVTGNGKWIVATCEKYLLVIPTQIPDSQKTGFQVRMGQNKPTPFRLQLLPEDLRLIGGKVNFTPAKFNTGQDGELWIVTSTGSHIITWNFKHVRKGKLSSYNIKKLAGRITSEQFMAVPHMSNGRNAPILVALQNDVKLQKRITVKRNPYRDLPSF